MLGFLKKIFGFPTEAEISAAKAPYKIESPMINNKTGEIVEPAVIPTEPKLNAVVVNDQITDAVTQTVEPAKKPRKPRTPKAEKPVKEKPVKEKAAKEKAAKPVKAAAKKVAVRRSKKA